MLVHRPVSNLAVFGNVVNFNFPSTLSDCFGVSSFRGSKVTLRQPKFFKEVPFVVDEINPGDAFSTTTWRRGILGLQEYSFPRAGLEVLR